MLKISHGAFVVSAVILSVIAAHAQDGKQDILGVSTGMTSTEVVKIIGSKRWFCPEAAPALGGDGAFTCQTELGGMNLKFARVLNGVPLIYVRLFFTSAEPFESVARSISQQYAKNPKRDGQTMTWELSSGRLLKLIPYNSQQHILDMIAPDLERQMKEAERQDFLRRNPTPKF